MSAKRVKEEYEEELCVADERQRQLLEAVFKKRQLVLHGAGLFTFLPLF